MVDAAYGDNALSISQINRIIKAVKKDKNFSDQCHSSGKKMKRVGKVLASIAATTRGLPVGTIYAILNDDLGLVKKLAR